MTVLVADKFEGSGLESLRVLGCEVGYQPDAAGDALVDALKTTKATVLIVRSTQVRPGVLAHVVGHLRAAHLNVQETENIIFDGGPAAVARINLDGAPAPAVLVNIRLGSDDILDLQLVTLS